MTQTRAARKVVTLTDIRDLATLPVHHSSKPSAAGLLGIGRSLAYAMAQRRELPTIRLGGRLVVPVPALLAMLGDPAHLIGAQAETAGQTPNPHPSERETLTTESSA